MSADGDALCASVLNVVGAGRNIGAAELLLFLFFSRLPAIPKRRHHRKHHIIYWFQRTRMSIWRNLPISAITIFENKPSFLTYCLWHSADYLGRSGWCLLAVLSTSTTTATCSGPSPHNYRHVYLFACHVDLQTPLAQDRSINQIQRMLQIWDESLLAYTKRVNCTWHFQALVLRSLRS